MPVPPSGADSDAHAVTDYMHAWLADWLTGWLTGWLASRQALLPVIRSEWHAAGRLHMDAGEHKAVADL